MHDLSSTKALHLTALGRWFDARSLLFLSHSCRFYRSLFGGLVLWKQLLRKDIDCDDALPSADYVKLCIGLLRFGCRLGTEINDAERYFWDFVHDNHLYGHVSHQCRNLQRTDDQDIWDCKSMLDFALTEMDLAGSYMDRLPDAIGGFNQLVVLNLEDNNLEDLPDSLGCLQELHDLCLASNALKTLPRPVEHLDKLTYLDVSCNLLSAIPPLHRLKALVELHLSQNAITRLPANFGLDTQLMDLDLSCNNLFELPESFGCMKMLKDLHLDHNKLTRLPTSFGNLKNLEHLHLDFNELEILPDAFGDLVSLKSLELGPNRLKSLPDSFVNLASLQSLNLDSNQLEQLPPNLGSMTALEHLSVRSNALEIFAIPAHVAYIDASRNCIRSVSIESRAPRNLNSAIGGLSLQNADENPAHEWGIIVIQTLNLDRNQLRTLPDTFSALDTLVELYLSDNELQDIPRCICSLASLESLNLKSNGISSIRECFGNITTLVSLEVAFNKLQDLPDHFGRLSHLRSLDISGNQFSRLPECISNLIELKRLYIDANGIEDISILASLQLSTVRVDPQHEEFVRSHKIGNHLAM